VELSNATLTNIKGERASSPDLEITVNRADLELVMAGKTTLAALEAEGKARLEGSRTTFDQIVSMLEIFTPSFAILPGTRTQ
jgi:alkyl sulfatase BDS1-like metallo-beta-lactamase superfamily hydrolase